MLLKALKEYGLENYASLIAKYCRVKPEALKEIGKDLKFHHIALPREEDVEKAKAWLSKK